MSWSSSKHLRTPDKSIDERIRIGSKKPSPQKYGDVGKHIGDIAGGKISRRVNHEVTTTTFTAFVSRTASSSLSRAMGSLSHIYVLLL